MDGCTRCSCRSSGGRVSTAPTVIRTDRRALKTTSRRRRTVTVGSMPIAISTTATWRSTSGRASWSARSRPGGRIEQDVAWFRAESARLLAVGASPNGGALERRAAIRYRVPLVPLDELAGFSRRHARPAAVARPMRGAVIVVLDCGPATIGCFDEIRSGCHRLIERARDWRIDLVVCGEGTFVVPLRGEGARRQSQLSAAVDFLVPDCEGPALARGVERARGHALWSHRRWSTNVVLVAVNPPDRETCEQLRRARRDGVRVLTVCPPPDGGWDRRLGEHLPIRPGSTGDLTEAMRDVAGKLQIQRGSVASGLDAPTGRIPRQPHVARPTLLRVAIRRKATSDGRRCGVVFDLLGEGDQLGG
jgi:hypothetical protein